MIIWDHEYLGELAIPAPLSRGKNAGERMAGNPRSQNGALRRKYRQRMKAAGCECGICHGRLGPIHYNEPSDAAHPLSFVIDEIKPVSRWKEFGYRSARAAAEDWNNLQAAQERKAVVLDQMEKYGYINRSTAEKTKKAEMKLVKPAQKSDSNTASYFIDYVTQKLIDKYGADAVYKEGLKIYTTLDMVLNYHCNDKTKFYIKGYNLTNESYESIAAWSGYYMAPGRSVIFGVQHEF